MRREINNVYTQQIFFWFTVFVIVINFNNREITEVFTLTTWPSIIVDVGILSCFFILFHFLNKISLYEKINKYKLSEFNTENNIKRTKWSFVKPLIPIISYIYTIFYAEYILNQRSHENVRFDFFMILGLITLISLLFINIYIHIIKSNNFLKRTSFIFVILSLLIYFYRFGSLSELYDVYQIAIAFVAGIFLYPFIYVLIYILTNFDKLFLQEYTLAKQLKIFVENQTIFQYFVDENKITLESDELNKINSLILHNKDSFKRKSHFRVFLNDVQKKIHSDKDFESRIDLFLLPVQELKLVRGQEIEKRNKDNLLVSLYSACIFFLLYFILTVLIYRCDQISESFLINYLNLVGVYILYRLFFRSIEICVSFYKDLQDHPLDKKSSLDKNDRANLALKSLAEIITLSFIVIFCLVSREAQFQEKSIFYFPLLEVYRALEIFMYTVSVSLFNVSFENLKDVISNNVIPLRIVHLIQVISSLVLLTICLSSYINSNLSNRIIKIKKKGSLITLVEFNKYENCERQLVPESYKDINTLKKAVKTLYKNLTITSDDYELYMRTIDNYVLKDE